jgi:hypothetical protein
MFALQQNSLFPRFRANAILSYSNELIKGTTASLAFICHMFAIVLKKKNS